VDLHAAPCGRGQFFDERCADAIAEHEGLERDVRLRGADGVQHCRIDLRAVDERGDVVAGHQRRPEQDAERAAEIRIAAGVETARPVEQTFFGRGEIRAYPDHERGDEQGCEDDGDDGHDGSAMDEKSWTLDTPYTRGAQIAQGSAADRRRDGHAMVNSNCSTARCCTVRAKARTTC